MFVIYSFKNKLNPFIFGDLIVMKCFFVKPTVIRPERLK